RRTGALAARGEAIVFVDDDNVLAPDYLLQARAILDAHPDVGAGGGKSFGEFATPPACWHEEFFGLLAIRDLGPAPLLSPVRTVDLARDPYPRCAPIGAGMALRASAAAVWLNESAPYALPDRQGDALSSGGDNDIILTVLRSGWRVGYFPELTLTHLIPANRLESAYLARLNRAIQRSWMLVQYKHGINSWPHLTRATVPLRVAKSWIRHRAWSGPANRVRWFGARGHFEGRVKH
ncbi:MAG TPA: hypothetical protein VHF69_01925, partial [Candidatus Synoicihabitans sp.]|nr:hypothetical protein [Candidatus Synoicihabitans sp.]